MGHVTGKEIQAALDTGKPVWSHAWGRGGRIKYVEGNNVHLRSGRSGRGQSCITWFNQGDHVKLVEYEKKWVIEADLDAQFGSMREEQKQEKQHEQQA